MFSKLIKYSIFIIIFVSFSGCKDSSDTSRNHSYKIVSYIRTWELKKVNGKNVFWKAEDIRGDLLTDLNIGFAEIRNGADLFIRSLEWDDPFSNLFQELRKIKETYPSLRINLSIGGWGVDGFSDIGFYKELRERFVNNVINWVEKYDFDGVDIDWEYPVSGGGVIKSRPSDRENFTLIMQELKNSLDAIKDKTGKNYTLSFAGGGFSEYLNWIEPSKLSKIVDYVNIMAYDFYGEWSKTTGHHANLYRSAYQPDNLSVDNAVNEYIDAGFQPERIVVGVPFFGKVWEGVKNQNHGLYQRYTKALYQDGIGYDDILNLIPFYSLKKYWDETAKAPFLYNGDVWISYDNKDSLKLKINYIKESNLGGVMIWEYSYNMNAELLFLINESLKVKEKISVR